MILAGKYMYMSQLRTLASCIPHNLPSLPTRLAMINSPLVVDQWRALLSEHPDGEFKEFLLSGIVEGFCIGFNYTQSDCRSAKRNMLSAMQNPSVVSDYLSKERSLSSNWATRYRGSEHSERASESVRCHPKTAPAGEVEAYSGLVSSEGEKC